MRKTALVVAAAVLATACFPGRGPEGPTVREHQVVALDKAELTRVRLRMGAGELQVSGGATGLMEADFAYNVPEWKPSVVHTSAGTESELEVSQGSRTSGFGDTENRWEVALNDTAPIDLAINLGAGEARMKLGSLNLRNVVLGIGAGEVEMDLRGHPTTSYSVAINGGVGSATVYVPTTVAISAIASGGIGEINVTGLENRNGRWINPRAETSPVTIDLNVRGGVGEIRIVAE